MASLSRRSFVAAYRRGRRDFRGVRLHGVRLGEYYVGGYEPLELQSCDFTRAVLTDCSFVGSNLTGSQFAYANLSDSNFARSTLTGCNFRHASLVWCNLNLANFSGAQLSHANLNATTIRRADFSHTVLTGVRFGSARLRSVLLTGARAAYLTLDDTVLSDLDLSVFVNARITITKHGEPSDVDWRSVAQSLRLPHNRLKAFLVTIGMPDTIAEWMIEAARALDPLDLFTLMQSTFISYGAPDEKFAIALRDELHKNGVTTFLFHDNAVPGQKLHHMMRSGVNNYDRCHSDLLESLTRPNRRAQRD
jgi:Pentapeptide repeats (9 copies)